MFASKKYTYLAGMRTLRLKHSNKKNNAEGWIDECKHTSVCQESSSEKTDKKSNNFNRLTENLSFFCEHTINISIIAPNMIPLGRILIDKEC